MIVSAEILKEKGLKKFFEERKEEFKKNKDQIQENINKLENKKKFFTPTKEEVMFSIVSKSFDEISDEEISLMKDEYFKIYSTKDDIFKIYNKLRMIYFLKEGKFAKSFYGKCQIYINRYKEKLNELINNYESGTILVNLKRENISQENISFIKGFALNILAKGLQVRIGIYSDMDRQDNNDKANYLYSKQESSLLKDLNDSLLSSGMKKQICFDELNPIYKEKDFDSAWTFDDVYFANQEIDKAVEYIKENNLSPYETILFLHMALSQIDYKEEEDDNFEASRVVVGFFKQKTIVCAGYASLIKAVIDKLDDKNLKCDIVACSFYRNKIPHIFQGSHCHNLIHINDDKYKIKGTYVEDVTSDVRNLTLLDDLNFAHFMLPVQDVSNFKLKYEQKHQNSRFKTLIIDGNHTSLIKQSKFYKLKTKVKKLFGKFKVPDIVKKYENESKPIEIKKFKEALKKVLSLKVVAQNGMQAGEFNLHERIARTIDASAIAESFDFNRKATKSFTKYLTENQNI